MRTIKDRKILLTMLAVILMLVAPVLVLADTGTQTGSEDTVGTGTDGDTLEGTQDGSEGEAPTTCNPVIENLALELGVDCQYLLNLMSQGHGLGEIMQAWHLSQSFDDFGTWEDLLLLKQTETGWGQMKMAVRLATDTETAQDLLDLKLGGVGWGQIKQAQALAGAGLVADFDEAMTMLSNGMGWGEIRDQLGLEPGPPPWSGSGKDKTDQGPPPWANGHGKNSGESVDTGTSTNPGRGNGNSGGNNGNGNGNGK